MGGMECQLYVLGGSELERRPARVSQPTPTLCRVGSLISFTIRDSAPVAL